MSKEKKKDFQTTLMLLFYKIKEIFAHPKKERKKR